MLLWLSHLLAESITFFNVFSYLTFRAILAATTALMIALLIGPWMIAKLTRDQIGQVVRDYIPAAHQKKVGTPTMGGLLILVAVIVATLLWSDLSNRFVWIVIGVTVLFGLVGFWDDYLKLVKKNPKGLIARYKYFWQSIGGLAAALALWYGQVAGGYDALSAVAEELCVAAGLLCLRAAHLPDDRGHEQRGEPHRRA